MAKVKGPSKWSEYITEEDNSGTRNGENMATEQGMDLKMMINDEMVEDDIHPDFKWQWLEMNNKNVLSFKR